MNCRTDKKLVKRAGRHNSIAHLCRPFPSTPPPIPALSVSRYRVRRRPVVVMVVVVERRATKRGLRGHSHDHLPEIMKINIPTIPPGVLAAARLKQPTVVHLPSVVGRIAEFLAPGNVAVLTGAGVSVDSGIRAYRGDDGRYMNPNYK